MQVASVALAPEKSYTEIFNPILEVGGGESTSQLLYALILLDEASHHSTYGLDLVTWVPPTYPLYQFLRNDQNNWPIINSCLNLIY